MGPPSVRVIREHKLIAEVPLAGALAIGRLPDNDLVLDDDLVSGHHGRIDRTEAGWRYTDLGSTNGSIVAAGPTLRRGQSALLREDSQLLLGATVIEVRLEPPGAAPPPSLVRVPAAVAKPLRGPPGSTPPALPSASAAPPTERGPRPGRPRVVVVGATSARTVPLGSERALLGRGNQCEVRVEDPSVSTQHAEIAWENGRWVLRDLNSRNGTRVGIQKVVGSREIRNNAHIILGEADLLFVDDAAQGAAAGPAATPAGDATDPRSGTAVGTDTVLASLERSKQLTRSQAQQARAALAAGGTQLGEFLVARRWLSPGEWTEALGEAGADGGAPRRRRGRALLLGGLLLVLLAALVWLLRGRLAG